MHGKVEKILIDPMMDSPDNPQFRLTVFIAHCIPQVDWLKAALVGAEGVERMKLERELYKAVEHHDMILQVRKFYTFFKIAKCCMIQLCSREWRPTTQNFIGLEQINICQNLAFFDLSQWFEMVHLSFTPSFQDKVGEVWRLFYLL